MPSSSTTWGPRAHFAFLFLQRILIWLLGLLVYLSAMRIFSCFFYSVPKEVPALDWLHAFVLGFRFDLSSGCYFLALPILLAGPWLALLPPRSFRGFLFFIRAYLELISVLVLIVTIVDLLFYSYFQDHLNIMFFGFFEDDTWALIRTFEKNYPILPLLIAFFATVAGLWWVLKKLFDLRTQGPTARWEPVSYVVLPVSFLLLILIGIGGRGTFALFPLGVADTAISTEPFVNYIAFSGIHSLHRAVKLKLREDSVWNSNERNYGYTDMRAEAQDFFLDRKLPADPDPYTWLLQKTPKNPWAEKTKPHVVVLMMESFGSSWLQYDSPKFQLLGDLKKHFAEDTLFMNFLPSMTATIGSLSALMINTPHRPEGGFLTESRYLHVPFRTAAARLYEAQGYKTRFIYGGAVGWRDIDKFARTQGFTSVEGDFEIEAKLGRKLEKHDWGLFDEDVWTYLEQTLKEATTPEMVVVMTTTNHPPYQLPTGYQPLPLELPANLKDQLNVEPDLALARFKAFQYSNQKLGEFLTRVKTSALADKTIISATGDHGFLLVNFSEGQFLQKWQVPFYLYIPKAARPARIDAQTFGSHADIWPTLMPLSFSEVEIPAFGTNMLDPYARHDAFHFSRLAMNKCGAVIDESRTTTRYFAWEADQKTLKPTEPNPELETLSKRYQALMSFLDEFYEFERKKPHENPGR